MPKVTKDQSITNFLCTMKICLCKIRRKATEEFLKKIKFIRLQQFEIYES